jgi:hypothetical protein
MSIQTLTNALTSTLSNSTSQLRATSRPMRALYQPQTINQSKRNALAECAERSDPPHAKSREQGVLLAAGYKACKKYVLVLFFGAGERSDPRERSERSERMRA